MARVRHGRRLAVALPIAGMLATGAVAAPAAAAGQQAPVQAVAEQGTWLVVAAGAGTPAARAAAEAAGAVVEQELTGLGQLVVRADATAAARLRASGAVRSVTADAQVTLSAGTYDPATDPGSSYNVTTAVGAREMWKAGLTGNGIDVAIIDSGVTAVTGGPRLVSGPDLSLDSQDPGARRRDRFGHGTDLASIIGGEDAGSSARTDPTAMTGVAPDSRVISIKVGDVNGGVDVSQVIAALDWVVQNRSNQMNLRVVNLSFGTDSKQAWNLDPLSYAAETVARKGIVVVAAAGNTGTVGLDDPAYNPHVLAVGASDPRGTTNPADDVVASYSTRGNGVRNPDLVAPGTGIVGLRSPGSVLDQAVPGNGSRWMRGTGTSQAAAVVSGAVALLLQQRSNLNPQQVKALLRASADPIAGASAADQGAGRLNLKRAMAMAVPAVPAAPAAGKGTGSLDASRGSQVQVLDGKPLAAEYDVFGMPWNSAQQAQLADSEAAWNQGYFNGQPWAQNYWDAADPVAGAEMTWGSAKLSSTLWSGLTHSAWSGRSWSGRSWSGRSWSGRSWSGRVWSDKHFAVAEGTAPKAASATTPATCSSLPAWSKDTVYNGGGSVVSGGKKWTARYWTQGNTPGDATGVWGTAAAC